MNRASVVLLARASLCLSQRRRAFSTYMCVDMRSRAFSASATLHPCGTGAGGQMGTDSNTTCAASWLQAHPNYCTQHQQPADPAAGRSQRACAFRAASLPASMNSGGKSTTGGAVATARPPPQLNGGRKPTTGFKGAWGLRLGWARPPWAITSITCPPGRGSISTSRMRVLEGGRGPCACPEALQARCVHRLHA